jgi:hypothetical protein
MGDPKVDKAKADKLNVIQEDKEDIPDEIYTNDDLQIIINQKEIKKSKCYKLPQQKVIIK